MIERRTRARLGRFNRNLALLGVAALVALFLLAGCKGGARSLGATQSWSGVAVSDDGSAAFVGTKDGRIIEIVLNLGSRGQPIASVGEEFEIDGRDEESRGNRVAPAFYGTPVLANGRVYAGSHQGFIYSMSAGADGGTALRDVGAFEIDGDILSKGITGTVVVTDGFVVAAASEDSVSGRLYVLNSTALDQDQGDTRIEHCRYPAQGLDPIGPIWSAPVVAGGVAYFGDLNHFVYAVRIDTCELIWSQPAELGGAIVAPPLIIGGNLYVGSFDRSFYALDLDNGSVSAPLFSAESWFWAGAATDGTRIYVPNLDGTLYAYDLSRQALAWSYDQEGGRERIVSAPVVVGNNIVLASDSGVITLLDSNMNTLRRLGNGDNDVRAPLTVADGIVFAHSLDEMIIAYAVDRNGLDNVWELKLPGF